MATKNMMRINRAATITSLSATTGGYWNYGLPNKSENNKRLKGEDNMKASIYLLSMILGLSTMSYGSPSAADETTGESTVLADSVLHYDGLYMDKDRELLFFLRFYPDGKVLRAGVLDQPEKTPEQIAQEVAQWLDKSYPAPLSFYKIQGTHIKFGFSGLGMHEGEILGERLALNILYRSISETPFPRTYRFIEVSFPKE